MMKSKINYKQAKPFYPRLMVTNDEETVVFFIKENVGVIVWSAEPLRVGIYGEAFSMDYYKEFKYSVELSND